MGGFSKDYTFWKENEKRVVEFLSAEGYTVVAHEDEMAIHDLFILNAFWKKVNVELKTRRVAKDTYPTTLIWANKLWEAWNKFYKNGEEMLFFFSFTDGLYFLSPFDHVPEERVFKLQRYDRGIDNEKGWLYYSVDNLIKIE